MKWQGCTVANPQQFGSISSAVNDWLSAGKMVDVRVRESAPSRLDAMKSLQHHWYNELSTQSGKSAKYINAFCKLHFGVPIAREDEEFRKIYDQVIKPLPKGKKIYLMGPPVSISVTSNFNTQQMSRYLNEIKQWAKSKGYQLTTSNDLYLKAMGE